MRNYESYNPAIPEDIDNGIHESLPEYGDIETPGPGKSHVSKPVKAKKQQSKKKRSDAKEREGNTAQKITGFFTSRTMKWIVGLFMGLFAVYLAIAFISYFGACVKDQSEINNTAIGSSGAVANAAGEGGARISEFLINEFFGVGSFVIIIWLFAVGLRILTGKPKFKAVNFTIKCLVALITVSLIVGLMTIGLETSVNWGGYHGRYVNEFIIHFVGWSGAVLLGIFMVACFVIICMRDVVKWVLKHKARFDEKRRIRKAEMEERKAREMELEAMRKEEDEVNKGETAESKQQEAEEDTDDLMEGDYKKPLEVRFGDETEGGLYGELPELDEDAYVYNIEDKKEPEGENSGEEKGQSEETTQGDGVDGHSDAQGEQPTETEGGDFPQEGGGGEDDLKMVVNVNTISQSHNKSQGIGNDSPEHFPYKFPSFDILKPGEAKVSVDPEEQMENKELIKKVLLEFKIPIVSITATVGPTVTLYEVVPDKGIRVARIRTLGDDIALRIAAEGIRIIAPIPGKGTVGIEVANKEKQTVSMRTVLQSTVFQQTKYKLPIALGSTISNEVFIADLAKMPHLLVAGATGQGKSVGLNAIITSLLYSKRPDELKFVLIDPKMVEFSLYAKIEGHYLAKLPEAEDAVITDMENVKATLMALCIEMDNRYQLMKSAATKNIIEYNDKIKAKKLNPSEGHKFMPYIVVIVDEFSDLIMTAGKEVEMPIARLAQKARAVGMHVIIATQRPSANVITGIIKANFPARIAFKVSSGVDSKTILDTSGAQQLIGRGDMLVSNNAPMVRVQCAFIDTPEVEEIAEYISRQPYQQGAYLLPEPENPKGDGEGFGGGGGPDDRDPLFDEVARLVVQTNNASTSSIQRRYRIGYNRAGSIMDQLERAGVVGPAQGGKARSVLMDAGQLELLLGADD